MKITIAKTAGFCFGVRNALKIAAEAREEAHRPVYTYGPMIHNKDAIASLEEKGIFSVDSMQELLEDNTRKRMTKEHPSDKEARTVIIRAHGIPRKEQNELIAAGVIVKDATCPFVKKIHRLVEEASEEGRDVLIIGDPTHPEVIGIKGWVKEGCEDKVRIFPSQEALMENRPDTNGCYSLVFQTTFDGLAKEAIIEFLKREGYNIRIWDTICSATNEHQNEAEELSEQSDVCLIIGGRHSSNTRKLLSICRRACKRSYLIENASELADINFQKEDRVGITAGASTPDETIRKVVETLESM